MESVNPVDQLGELHGKTCEVSVAESANVKFGLLRFSNSPELTGGHHAQATSEQRDRETCIHKRHPWITFQQQPARRHDLDHPQRQPLNLRTLSSRPQIRDQSSVCIKHLHRSLLAFGAEKNRFTSIRSRGQHQPPDLISEFRKGAQWQLQQGTATDLDGDGPSDQSAWYTVMPWYRNG